MNYLFISLGFIDKIGEKAQAFIDKILNKIITPLQEMGTKGQWWLEGLIILAAAVLMVCGAIFLLSKCWKIILVLAVLAILGIVIYFVFIKKGGDVTTTAAQSINFIKLNLQVAKALL